MEGKLTVLFDPPYWVGIFEKIENDQIQAARFVFGAEPTEPQLLKFALKEYTSLQFSPPVPIGQVKYHPVNFKRKMREIRAQMETQPRSTHAQEVLQQELENRAVIRKKNSKEDRIQLEDRKFKLRKDRKAEKHRGH
ncbi:MAG TPA: YjdF family protein [Leptolinea sp.]